MARPSQLTKAQIARICALRENDPHCKHSWKVIAEAVGCSAHQARYWCRQHDVKGPRDLLGTTDEIIEKICELRENDPKGRHSWKFIADEVGCTPNQACYWGRQCGAIGPRDQDRPASKFPALVMRGNHVVRRFTDKEKQVLRSAQELAPRPTYASLARELRRPPNSIRAFYQMEARREAMREGL